MVQNNQFVFQIGYVVWFFSWLMIISAFGFNVLVWVATLFLLILGIPFSYGIVSAYKEVVRDNIEITPEKAVFITGCDTGFGHELALRLDKLGFTVYAGCLDPDSQNSQRLTKLATSRLKVVEIDVTSDEKVKSALEFVKKDIEKAKCKLHALVNNAGIATGMEAEFCAMSDFKNLMEVNTFGIVRATKAFLPLIRKQPGGRIVIVSSIAGKATVPAYTAYCMSKHAATAFADGLRIEMRKWGISVHIIEPTYYKTNIIRETENFEVQKSMDKWKRIPKDVEEDYGEEYFDAFIESQLKVVHKVARPPDKIHEVINDMVDAVAGEHPKIRYIPNIFIRIIVFILCCIPTAIADIILEKVYQPRVLPAARKRTSR